MLVNPKGTAVLRNLKSREIQDSDISEVVTLLTRGFGRQRSRKFWQHVLARLASRSVPAGFPRYGYVLENDGKFVGVVLAIYATVWIGDRPTTRCNVSSWYVEPAFRSYAPFLAMRVLKKRNVTILNVSAMPHTRSIAVAQGYTCYSNGTFIAIPILSRNSNTMHVRIIESNTEPDVPFNVHDRELLLEHADYGCVSLWCVTPERAYPFVFRSRMLKGVLRCMQLIYCSDLSEFVRFAGPIGAFLTRKMQFLVMLDANGPLQGLVGRYFPDKMIKYFSGPEPPRLGDLAYTETAMFGI